ncbi:hypothetical protein RRG08_013713 [Elysia crispata]|uniref:Uncharacterized protein n=1 Tax=Elysia crispata TaxID=231223 RepID=A0AAE0Z875_9GAST|nr:hypothetical protein RRG08_013713 [Elysia crispata]
MGGQRSLTLGLPASDSDHMGRSRSPDLRVDRVTGLMVANWKQQNCSRFWCSGLYNRVSDGQSRAALDPGDLAIDHGKTSPCSCQDMCVCLEPVVWLIS